MVEEQLGSQKCGQGSTGTQYEGAINVVTTDEVFKEMKAAFTRDHLGVNNPVPSKSKFRDLFEYWMKVENIRMRLKKNVSSKCKGKVDRCAQITHDCQKLL